MAPLRDGSVTRGQTPQTARKPTSPPDGRPRSVSSRAPRGTGARRRGSPASSRSGRARACSPAAASPCRTFSVRPRSARCVPVPESDAARSRTAASEQRLLLQIDGERQKTKQANAASGELERRAEASREKLEAARKMLSCKLQEAEVDLSSMRQALASANVRSSEL